MLHTYCISNGQIVLPDRIIPLGSVVVKGKRIATILKGGKRSIPYAATEINGRGGYVSPGFIDLHIHGELRRIAQQQIRGGTTGFLATLHPAQPKELLRNISRVLDQRKAACAQGAKMLGLCLEGPFLSRVFCGALPPRKLRRPHIQELRRIIKHARGAVKMVVVAPELKGARRIIRLLRRHKIAASLGHTAATYEEAQQGIDVGIRHATHTFNRMSGFGQRSPGALGAVLTDERITCDVIADGVHVHPAAFRMLAACKGLDKISLITDSTAALEYPPKKKKGAVFELKDGTLYGTALTLNSALKNAVRFLNLPLHEAVKLVTLNPAKVLKIDKRKGSIAAGKDADIVIFDQDFKIQMAMVEGKIVYQRKNRRCVG